MSDTEAEVEHTEPTPKKGKVETDKPARGAGSTGTGGVIIKGPSRGGRKSVDKNEPAKKAGKLEKEPEEELDENTPSKRKRGRPKGSGRKDSDAAVSGDDLAGPSSDTTPTISAKKGKPVSSEPRSTNESTGKKRGRPAKPKTDEEEKSGQKKKVHFVLTSFKGFCQLHFLLSNWRVDQYVQLYN